MKAKEDNAFDQLVALSYLPFDSEIFGFPFFRLNLKKIDRFTEDIKFLRKSGTGQFGCDAKISTEEEDLLTRAVSLGFKIICQQTTLELDTSQISTLDDYSVKICEEMTEDEILLHSINFNCDRLSLDPRIAPNIASKFYSNWIRNSFCIRAKRTYVLKSGFCISFKLKDQLKIDLVSVLEKRKKIGERLLLKVLHDAKLEGQKIVQVTTESHNEGAIGLYKKCGFEIVSTHKSLHFLDISD